MMDRRTIVAGLLLTLPLIGCQRVMTIFVKGDPDKPTFRFRVRSGDVAVPGRLTVHRIGREERSLVWAATVEDLRSSRVQSLDYGDTRVGLRQLQTPLPLVRDVVHLVQISGGQYLGAAYFTAPKGRLLVTQGSGDRPLRQIRQLSGIGP